MENPVPASQEWDLFISHASEDKPFVRPLAEALRGEGLSVWYDEFTLNVGDSLRRSIDDGLVRSKRGVVVISSAFLKKEWPNRELDALVTRESAGTQLILPVWHNVSADEVAAHSPLLADRIAISSSKGFERVVLDILRAIGRTPHSPLLRSYTGDPSDSGKVGHQIFTSGASRHWARTAVTLLEHANRRLDNQIQIALSRASTCFERKVPYVYGGKNPEGLDCSGLVTHCFPRVLPDGVERQAERLAGWLFDGSDLRLVEVGDLVFFSESEALQLSHVAITERRISEKQVALLHASERLGSMSRDIWDVDNNTFRNAYVARHIAKMRPFLLRLFLEDEINRELRNVDA